MKQAWFKGAVLIYFAYACHELLSNFIGMLIIAVTMPAFRNYDLITKGFHQLYIYGTCTASM